MGRNRRGELRILMDILTLSLREVKATHLMYKANLSYSTLQKYMSVALKQGLVEKIRNSDGSVAYHITDKGKLLLEKLRDVVYVLKF